jgi:hypothetical protein
VLQNLRRGGELREIAPLEHINADEPYWSGLPGSMYHSWICRLSHHSVKAIEVNSLPLSARRALGLPCISIS